VQRKICEVCGCAVSPGELVIHRIVPEEIAKQVGILDVRKVVLCLNCGNQIQDWYNKRVFSMSYDDKTNRFIPKSSTEMVKEYEAAYKAFATYKKAAVKL
jgi:hypothetical protein